MPSAENPARCATPAGTRRAMCAHCERPVAVCYCPALATLATRTRVVILQHPREQGMPIGTARMAHLCLPNSSLHVGVRWDDSDVLREACGDPQRPPILLYPGPHARDILRDPPPSASTLIVVDGTWSQARSVVRNNPQLAGLARYAFHAPEPSHYRIRREPRDGYVSTLEALMHALGALEGDAERFRVLRAPMNAMVDAQLAAQAASTSYRQPRVGARKKRDPCERLPREIREQFDDLVLIHADANAWPWGTPQRQLGDELVHWVALRPSTGETFSYVRAPRHPLAPDIPRHTGLPAAMLLAGGGSADLLAAFSQFTRTSDVLASWGHHALRLFKACGGRLPGTYLDLQRIAGMLTNAKTGSLDHYAAAQAESAARELPPGRAGRRLGMLGTLVDAWRDAARR